MSDIVDDLEAEAVAVEGVGGAELLRAAKREIERLRAAVVDEREACAKLADVAYGCAPLLCRCVCSEIRDNIRARTGTTTETET